MNDSRTKESVRLQRLQEQANIKLDTYYAPPQRYGTAFHLSSPVLDVRMLPHEEHGNDIQKSWELLTKGNQAMIADMVQKTVDPYLLRYVAFVDTLPVSILHVQEGQSVDVALQESRCLFIILENGARLSLYHSSIDERIGTIRTYVWQKEESQFVYWGVRARNVFLDEQLTTYLGGRKAKAHIRHLTVGSASDQSNIAVQAYHQAQDTESNLLVRSAASQKHVSIYRGLIDIDESASGSVGYEQGQALLLSSGAVVDNLPELAIRTNNVRCSHGITTTHIDDASLFYMRSRGLSYEEARELAIRGFYHDKIEIPQSVAAMLEAVL